MSHTRRITVVICSVFCAAARRLPRTLLLLLSFLCFDISLAHALSRTVKVGVYENAPKVFTSEAGKPSGIFVEIIEHIARQEGWELRYVPGTWTEGLDRLANGEIDLMTDVAYTSEREKLFSFHKTPVLSVWSQVYAPKGSGIQSILDLNGKRVAALENTIQLETFTRMVNSFGLKITLVPVPDYKTEFKMISEGKADAGLTNRLYGLMYARKSGLEDTPIMFDPAPFFFAAPRNASGELQEAIDRHLQEMMKDPKSAYYAAMKRWTSEEVHYKLPVWLQISGLVLGVALLMSLVGSFVLKHQVNARTRELELANQDMERRINERTLTLQETNEQLTKEIEERVRAEQMLIERESQYRDLVESANCVILRWLPDGRITFFNRFAQVFFGYSEEEIINKNIVGTVVPVMDSTGHELASLAADIVAHPADYVRSENENICKNGERVWVAWTNKPIFNADGSTAEILSIGVDITQSVHTEQELRRTLDELAVAKEHAEVADQIKSAFLATMSHELRTPLNSIIGFTGILLQELGGPINEEQAKQLTMVKSSANHLLSLISDVLDISKIEAGQLTVANELLDLKASIFKIVQIVRPLAEKKGLELSFDVADDVGTARADERRVEQVLLNLLSNAVKFTERGGVSVRCVREADKYLTTITDTGIGINTDDVERLFKPFHQVDNGLSRKYEGTGLGLSICKRLAELMGGEVGVKSEYGTGSTFWFTVRAVTD